MVTRFTKKTRGIGAKQNDLVGDYQYNSRLKRMAMKGNHRSGTRHGIPRDRTFERKPLDLRLYIQSKGPSEIEARTAQPWRRELLGKGEVEEGERKKKALLEADTARAGEQKIVGGPAEALSLGTEGQERQKGQGKAKFNLRRSKTRTKHAKGTKEDVGKKGGDGQS